MRARDLLILGAIVLVAGFAVADAIRGDESSGPKIATDTERSRTTTESVVPEPDENLGRTRQPPVSGAPGTIVLTEAGECSVREFQVATGTELPNVVSSSTCELWAAPVTAKVAVGVGPARGDSVPFRFVDLAHPRRNLGGYRARFGFVIWSPDGQRAAWCGENAAFDLELGADARRLPECPAAYTLENEIAYAVGNRVVSGGRTLARASGGVTLVRFGNDGSLAVVVEGRRIERYARGQRQGSVDLPERLEGRAPIFSPDNCAAGLRDGETVRVLDLGCSRLQPDQLPGFTAAWSPDGRWLAVAGAGAIDFYDLSSDFDDLPGPRLVETWPITAARLAWRR
jgi:hypothetical protein